MNKTMRIDKFLSEMNIGSRKEIKEAVKKGRIKVNDVVIKSSDLKISPDIDEIYYDNKLVKYVEYGSSNELIIPAIAPSIKAWSSPS